MWAQYSNFPVSIHLYLHAMASYFRIIFLDPFTSWYNFLRGLEHFIILLFSPKEYAINISKRHYSSGAHMHIRKPKRQCNVTWTLLREKKPWFHSISPNQSTGSTWLRFQALDWIAHDFLTPCQLHHHLQSVIASISVPQHALPYLISPWVPSIVQNFAQ
jgi:hypothetical protein